MNQVQIKHVNETARPFMESLVKIKHDLDVFVADYDALQAGNDALPEDSTVLDDNVTGNAPRDDAPQLIGQNLKALRDFAASMSSVVSAQAEQVLIQKMVRSLAVVLNVRD